MREKIIQAIKKSVLMNIRRYHLLILFLRKMFLQTAQRTFEKLRSELLMSSSFRLNGINHSWLLIVVQGEGVLHLYPLLNNNPNPPFFRGIAHFE